METQTLPPQTTSASVPVSNESKASTWNFSSSEWKLFWIFILLSLFAKGAAVYPLVYTVDDYAGRAIWPANAFYTLFIPQGRFIAYLLCKYSGSLGVPPTAASAFYSGLFLVANVVSGLVICRLWAIRDKVLCSAVVIGVVSLHPYQADFLTFKIAMIAGWFAQSMAFLAIYICSRKLWTFALAVVCLVLSIATYQSMLLFATVALLMGGVVRWFTMRDEEGENSWRAVFLQGDYIYKFAALPAAAVVYLITNKIIQWKTQMKPAGWGQTASFSELPGRVVKALQFHYALLMNRSSQPGIMNREPLNPLVLKRILLVCLIITVVGILIATFRRISTRKKFSSLADPLVHAVLIIAAAYTVVAAVMFGQWWWPGPRIVSSYGVFWAGLFCAAYVSSHRFVRYPLVVLGFLAVLIFGAITCRVFTDQQRLNMREISVAGRMVGELEKTEGFSKVTKLAILGSLPVFPSPIVMCDNGGLNPSALATPWAKLGIMNEVGGMNFQPPNEKEKRIAEELFQRSPKWPSPGSVVITNNLAVICLPKTP